MTSPKHQVEALLFSSGKTMTVEKLAELAKLSKPQVTRALKALKKDYEDRDSSVTLYEVENGWKMGVTNEHLALVKNVVADTEISRATMETLAIIAYKYPAALQSSVVDTRGGSAYEHIKELEELGFVKKEKLGRSYKIKLTEKFFDYFDIAGEEDIRKVFKNVKPPEPTTQKKLGDMDVVNTLEDAPEGPVGNLEVVEVSEEPEKPDLPEEEESSEDVEKTKEELGKHKQFLDDLDAKIDAIGKRMDHHDDDPLLKREEESEESEDESDDDTEEKDA